MTTPANMRWKLVDRTTGAENHAIDWRFRVGDRVKIRLVNEMDSDHPMHHPFHIHGAGRFLVLAPRRRRRAEPGLEGHGARAHRRDRRHPARRHQPRPVDGALPHRRAPRERHDVQLPRRSPRRRDDGRHEVVVVGAGQAGLAIGYLLARQGRRFSDPRRRRRAGGGVAHAVGLADAVHAGALRQPARAARSRATRTATRAATTWSPTSRTTRATSSCPSSSTAPCARPAAATMATSSSSTTAPTRPIRSSWRPDRSRSRACPRSPSASTPDVVQFHSTAYRTPEDVPAGPVLVVGGGNTGFQIAEELAAPTRFICRSARGRHRCRSASSAATCSAISRPPASWARPSTRGSASGCSDRDTLIGSSRACRAPPRHRAPRPDRRRVGHRGQLRATAARLHRTPSSGRPASDSTTRGSHAPVFDDDGGPRPQPRRHRVPGPVLPRPAVAAHARLRAAGLGQGRRRVPRRPDRRDAAAIGAS